MALTYHRKRDEEKPQDTADPWQVFGMGFDHEAESCMATTTTMLTEETVTATDEAYMRRCLQLARNGRQNAQPNPMVGAVIAAPDGRIIGEGYHVRCGKGHAEVHAFASVRPSDESLLPQSTLYVSLEPCSHYGKTPPCADLIINKRVRRCVVGCVDPFDLVQGRGIRKIREAGIPVAVGALEKECRELNRRFITYHSLHRPYITLKWAKTSDGFVNAYISNRYTQMLCHRLRAEHQAILVGRHTWETDQPQLNVRTWYGPDPRILVLSHQHGDLETQLRQWAEEGVQSLLVEGGPQTHQGFIDAGLWDEAFVEASPMTLGKGVAEARLRDAVLRSSRSYFGHFLFHYQHETQTDGNALGGRNQR